MARPIEDSRRETPYAAVRKHFVVPTVQDAELLFGHHAQAVHLHRGFIPDGKIFLFFGLGDASEVVDTLSIRKSAPGRLDTNVLVWDRNQMLDKSSPNNLVSATNGARLFIPQMR
jgi:hypothetical protein